MKKLDTVKEWAERTALFVGESLIATPVVVKIIVGFTLLFSAVMFGSALAPQIIEGDQSFKLKLLNFSLYALIAAVVMACIGFVIGMIIVYLSKRDEDENNSYY